MRRRRFTRAEQDHINGLVEKRLAQSHRRFRDVLQLAEEDHAEQIVKLRHTVDELVQISGVLSDALDRLEAENGKLRKKYAFIETQHRRGAMVVVCAGRVAAFMPDDADLPLEAGSINRVWFDRWIDAWRARHESNTEE